MKPSKVTPAVVLSTRRGGAVSRQHATPISLEDILPYAPRVDRADYQAWTQDDTCPQQRINYAEEAVCGAPASRTAAKQAPALESL